MDNFTDIRKKSATYYDLWPMPFDDIPFYQKRIESYSMRILELGCGTGRVMVRLINSCTHIHGIDISPAMIKICREKVSRTGGYPSNRITCETGDITSFNLRESFDLIIAPYRVFQNLETDSQVNNFFSCLKKHLSPGGRCILNVFHPWPVGRISDSWGSDEEEFYWDLPHEDYHVMCYMRQRFFDEQKHIIYPETFFYIVKEGNIIDSVYQKIPMRFYYPDEFVHIIEAHGFTVTGKWGGYNGESYGHGSELIIQFSSRSENH